METLISLLWILVWSASLFAVAGSVAFIAAKVLNFFGRRRGIATKR